MKIKIQNELSKLTLNMRTQVNFTEKINISSSNRHAKTPPALIEQWFRWTSVIPLQNIQNRRSRGQQSHVHPLMLRSHLDNVNNNYNGNARDACMEERANLWREDNHSKFNWGCMIKKSFEIKNFIAHSSN